MQLLSGSDVCICVCVLCVLCVSFCVHQGVSHVTLCKKEKFPTQHVTAGYLARPYPKGEPKKTSLGGPSRHLKFGQNLVLGIVLLPGVNINQSQSFTLFQTQRPNGKSSCRCTDDPPTWGTWSCTQSFRIFHNENRKGVITQRTDFHIFSIEMVV